MKQPSDVGKATILPLGAIRGWVGVLPVLPYVGAPRQEPLHEVIVLVQMLDGEGMVRAWPLEQLLEVVRSALRGLLTTPVVGGGHE